MLVDNSDYDDEGRSMSSAPLENGPEEDNGTNRRPRIDNNKTRDKPGSANNLGLDSGYELLIPGNSGSTKRKNNVVDLLRKRRIEHWIVKSPQSLRSRVVREVILNSQDTEGSNQANAGRCVGTKVKVQPRFSRKPVEYRVTDMRSTPSFDEVSDLHIVAPDHLENKYVVLKPRISNYLTFVLDEDQS